MTFRPRGETSAWKPGASGMDAAAIQIDDGTTAGAAGELGEVLRDYLAVAQRLQVTHESLQREVIRLRTELASKDRELERRRRLAALGELAAGVAHEVRNPLGAIQLYSGLLRSECSRAALSPALALLEKIESGIRAIDGIVADTLALAPRARARAGCRLSAIVEQASEFAGPALAARGARLETHFADRDARVLADEAGLQRVIINLIVNAADASPPGGVVRVDCSGAAEGLIELRVTDQGDGLPEEILDRIFDPFFTTKPHGTGLGLSIAARLVESYGGRLSAANRAAGGAEFCVALRAAQGGSEQEPDEVEARRTTAA